MTEPTDAELIALLGDRQFSSIGAVREALRRWGTPPAVAGEPCGWAMFRPDGSMVHGSSETSAEACLFALSESEVACGQKPGYMAATKGWKPQPIYTTPQPTQAQAGAVPLTDEQWQRIADLTGGRILTQAVKDEIERVIGIKGGQHDL